MTSKVVCILGAVGGASACPAGFGPGWISWMSDRELATVLDEERPLL